MKAPTFNVTSLFPQRLQWPSTCPNRAVFFENQPEGFWDHCKSARVTALSISLYAAVIRLKLARRCSYMSRLARKSTLWTLRKVSTRTNLRMSRRLTRTDNVRLRWIFCIRDNYSIPVSPWDGDCAGWSGSIHYEEAIMLVFSWNRSYVTTMYINTSPGKQD